MPCKLEIFSGRCSPADVKQREAVPTEDQIKDADRLQRYIEREQLVSVMNNTKWHELRALMLEEASFSPRYRVKCLRTTDDRAYCWDGDWYHHLHEGDRMARNRLCSKGTSGSLCFRHHHRQERRIRAVAEFSIHSLRVGRRLHSSLWVSSNRCLTSR